MKKEEFEKFLEQKVGVVQEAKRVDWEAKKRNWLKNLAGFYLMVEEYLAPFKKTGKIRWEMVKILLSEQFIGEYQADSMLIFFGAEKVTLMPIGTTLIGARGRVDMTGPTGTVKFILTGKHSDGMRISFTVIQKNQQRHKPSPQMVEPEEFVWKIATSPPNVRFIELNPETFFSALTEVANG